MWFPVGHGRIHGGAPDGACPAARGQVVAVVGLLAGDDAEAGWLAVRLAAFWQRRGLRVALRPGLRSLGGRRPPPGERWTAGLASWARRAQHRAHFALVHLAGPAPGATNSARRACGVDRWVVVTRHPEAAPGQGDGEDLLCVVEATPAGPTRVGVGVGGCLAGWPEVWLAPVEAVAYLGCQLMVPPACRPAAVRLTGPGSPCRP